MDSIVGILTVGTGAIALAADKISWGSLADWIAAVGSGTTAFFVWLANRPPPPSIHVVNKRQQMGTAVTFKIAIRNHDPRETLSVEKVEISDQDRWELRWMAAEARYIDVEPGERWETHCQVEARPPVGELPQLPEIIIAVRRRSRSKRYKRQL